ncbi:MAG: peptidoglycan DD-metalloendopeptidase family protein [Bacteroidetes bacterium]|nr:peptidoglycan DD-metalloendopeptidase family protein [Bacteroidota bacterium]
MNCGLPKHSKLKIFFLSGFILITFLLSGQTRDRKKLEQEKTQIEEEIRYNNELLDETRQTRKTSLNELVLLEKQVGKREQLITAINKEIRYYEQKINSNNDSIRKLTSTLEQLKEEYARMIYYAYKNRNVYNRLMFIFSSEDFNQAYRRLKYFQQYGSHRKTQAELIKKTQHDLELKTQEMEDQKRQKEQLLAEQESEMQKLAQEKDQKSKTVNLLSKREKELKEQLKAKEKAAANLQKAITEIIAEEIRLAEEKAKREANMTTRESMSLTPAELELSNDFAQNRGRLPWPTEKGVVSSSFGEHDHPVLKRVKVNNNGIDIVTSTGSKARAVFSGTVTRVISIPSYHNGVIIRHGEYLSVYLNLDQVFVSKGQTVQTLQELGTIHHNQEEGKTELHFELWKSKTLMDPMHWLLKL